MMPLARTGYADTFARDNLPPAASWPALEFATDLLKYPERLNAAAEAHRRSGHGLRPGPARAQDPGRRRVDLRRAAGAGQPDRAGADRGPRPGHRQPRAAARAEQPVDRRRLARRHQGRRHRRHHDGRAAGPRARPDRRQDQAVDRAGRSPVYRRRARGRRQHFSRAAGRRLRRRRRGRPDPADPRQAGRLRRGGHRGRRRGALRPHVGQHRRPEDHHPLPPRPAVHRQHLRQADPAAAAGGPGRLHGAARLHVRPRDAGGVHAPRGGVRLPHRDGDAGPAGGPGRRAPGHGARHRAHGLPADPAGRQGRPAVGAAHRGQRGRAHTARDLAAAAGRGRAAGHRRHRRDRDAAHLHQRGRRRHQAGGHRQAGPRLPGRHPRRRGEGGRARCRGAAGGDRPGRLPLPRRRAAGQVRRRTAGTSPGTRSCGTTTATSGTRDARTT